MRKKPEEEERSAESFREGEATSEQASAVPESGTGPKPDISGEKDDPVAEEKPSGPVWRWIKLVAEFIFVVVVFLLVISSGTYQETEKQISEIKMFFTPEPAGKDQVVIVAIDNDDYQKLFDSKSPLDPNKLQELISAVAKFRPKVIGVDIFTPDEKFKNINAENFGVPVVWAQDAARDPERKIVEPGGVISGFAPALGGGPLPRGNRQGPTLLPMDDGKVRFYQRSIEAADGAHATFPWLVFQLSKTGQMESVAAQPEKRYINYSGQVNERQLSYRAKFSASDLIKLAPDSPIGAALRDKVVLVGGYYEENKAFAAVDVLSTPLGDLYGVDVLASIVETENQGGGNLPIGFVAKALLNILITVVMMVLFYYFSFWKAMGISFVISIALAVVMILVFGNSLVLPALVFILLLKITDKAKDYGKDHMKNYIGKAFGLSKDKPAA